MNRVIQMHGCGYGDDGPLVRPKFQGDHPGNLRIEKRNAVYGSLSPAIIRKQRLQRRCSALIRAARFLFSTSSMVIVE
jgi:hypothetical protein